VRKPTREEVVTQIQEIEYVMAETSPTDLSAPKPVIPVFAMTVDEVKHYFQVLMDFVIKHVLRKKPREFRNWPLQFDLWDEAVESVLP